MVSSQTDISLRVNTAMILFLAISILITIEEVSIFRLLFLLSLFGIALGVLLDTYKTIDLMKKEKARSAYLFGYVMLMIAIIFSILKCLNILK